jgi:hypothetical protein
MGAVGQLEQSIFQDLGETRDVSSRRERRGVRGRARIRVARGQGLLRGAAVGRDDGGQHREQDREESSRRTSDARDVAHGESLPPLMSCGDTAGGEARAAQVARSSRLVPVGWGARMVPERSRQG